MAQITFHGKAKDWKGQLYIEADTAAQQRLGRKDFFTDRISRLLERAGARDGDEVLVLAEPKGGKVYIEGVSVIGGSTPVTVPVETIESIVDGLESYPVQSTDDESDKLEFIAPFALPEGLFPCIPADDPNFAIPEGVATTLSALMMLVRNGERVNIRLTGPQGSGKTSLAQKMAAKLGWNFVKIDVGGIREAADWWSHTVVEEGSTRAVPSLFSLAMTTPYTVVLLDELNRVPTFLHNAIYGVLDEHAYAWSDELEVRIERAPFVLVVSTMNLEDTNVGVFEVDSAMLDRFPFEVRLELLEEAILAKVIELRTGCTDDDASKLAKLAHSIEALVGTSVTHGTGHRALLAAAKLLKVGLGWEPACTTTVASLFDAGGGGIDTERMIVINLIQSE